MLTLYLVAYATVQMYDITTNRQSILLKRNGKIALFFRNMSSKLLGRSYQVAVWLLSDGIDQYLYFPVCAALT